MVRSVCSPLNLSTIHCIDFVKRHIGFCTNTAPACGGYQVCAIRVCAIRAVVKLPYSCVTCAGKKTYFIWTGVHGRKWLDRTSFMAARVRLARPIFSLKKNESFKSPALGDIQHQQSSERSKVSTTSPRTVATLGGLSVADPADRLRYLHRLCRSHLLLRLGVA
jgi:hypothetical protein